MKSGSNTESDEKMKSESTTDSDKKKIKSGSNTENDEKMKSESTTDSDKKKMSDSNTSDSEEKKDIVPELKSAEAVANEKGKGERPIIIGKTKRSTLQVPEEVKCPHPLKASSNMTDVRDMDVVPIKAADHKRKGMERKSAAEDVCETVKADTEEVCQKFKKGRKADNNSRKIKIFNLECGVAEINLDTTLFDGTYDDTIPVMVRVVPIGKTDFDTKMRIHRSCEDENIVRIYAVERDEKYNYIAFEKCDYTLEECIANSKTPKAEMLKLLMGVIKGLKHLNAKSVIHGNLKSTNVMVKQDGDKHTVKICALENCRHTKEGEDPRLDMRDLGMIFLECLTDDTGFVKLQRKEQEKMVNIKLAKLLLTFKEAYDIISKLLNHTFYPRLTYDTVFLHPIFWSWLTRLTFLVDSCEILKKLKKDSLILNEINGLGSILFNQKWTEEINKDWYNSMKNVYTEDVYGLLKIIRDTNNHLLDIKPDNWDREQLESYISGCYPTLMMNVYDVLKVHYSQNRLLKVYFRERL